MVGYKKSLIIVLVAILVLALLFWLLPTSYLAWVFAIWSFLHYTGSWLGASLTALLEKRYEPTTDVVLRFVDMVVLSISAGWLCFHYFV